MRRCDPKSLRVWDDKDVNVGKLSWLVLVRRVLEPILRKPVKKWNRKQSFKIFIFHLFRIDAESFIIQKILVIFRSNWLTGIKWNSCRPCCIESESRHMVTYVLSERNQLTRIPNWKFWKHSDILWYPIKNVDTQFTKKNGAYLPNDLKFLSGAMNAIKGKRTQKMQLKFV